MNAFQYFVNNLCKEKNMKKKELAAKLNITPATLSQNLAKGNPNKRTIRKIGLALGYIMNFGGNLTWGQFDDMWEKNKAEFMMIGKNKKVAVNFCSTTTFGTDFAYSYIG